MSRKNFVAGLREEGKKYNRKFFVLFETLVSYNDVISEHLQTRFFYFFCIVFANWII